MPYTIEGNSEGVKVTGANVDDVTTAMDLLEAARRIHADAHLHREELVKAMTVAGIDPTPVAAVKQAHRVAKLRTRLLAREGGYTYRAMVETFGYPNEDAARSSISKLRRGGLFTVSYDGHVIVPAFQLADDGRHIRPEVAEVATALGGIDPWEAWTWWCTTSSLLSGERPLDVLETAPGRVVRAASRFAARSGNTMADAGSV